jgi:GalNAc-alpha-(1->4)-GalNAc-alpha-(1->3)-diNAcBac-PP-undecaprenol alpha-1,4-N-acetyl-D-galactosaminyltransferase
VRNYDVVIITFEKKQPFYFLDERVKVVACMERIKKSSSFFQSLKLNYSLANKVSKIMRSEKVDIAIGFITSANIIATLAAKINGIPSIISERNNPLRGDVPKFWVILRKFVYPMADRLVLQTTGVKKIYEKKINTSKIAILPNPISSELSKFRDTSIKKEKIILTVGRLDDNKCQETLIEAIKDLNLEGWKVLIIGDGIKKQNLNALIEKHKLIDKIKIISNVKRIDHYYNKASIFVFTSKTEGFPNALLEAMHYGLPSISTDCKFGPSDLITDGYNGYLTKINDKEELKEKLTLLINDTKLQQKFSERAQETADDYVCEKVVSQWESLINSLL